MRMAPLDYGPVLLRKPFGSRLAADTLPSGCPCGQNPTVGASPWLCPSFPTSCPHRVRHGRVPQPTRHYPRLWIHRPSFGRPRDLNPPDQNAAQHTLCDAPTPRRPSRPASVSRADTTVASVIRDWRGIVPPDLRTSVRPVPSLHASTSPELSTGWHYSGLMPTVTELFRAVVCRSTPFGTIGPFFVSDADRAKWNGVIVTGSASGTI